MQNLSIYKLSNKEKSSLETIEKDFPYKWTTGGPYLLETIHASSAVRQLIGERIIKEGNKSLAGFGDSVNDLWVWNMVLECSGKASLADKIRQELLCNEALTHLGRKLKLDELLIIAPGTPRVSDKMLATMVEALMGAVFKDGGMEAVENVMESLGIAAAARTMIEEAMQ